jgi:surface antigen
LYTLYKENRWHSEQHTHNGRWIEGDQPSVAFETNLNLYTEKVLEGGSKVRLRGSDRLARDGAWSKIKLAYMVGVVAIAPG